MPKRLSNEDRAELRLLRDNQRRLIAFDGGVELMSWVQAHKRHSEKPYIGCPFCEDQFMTCTEAQVAVEAVAAQRNEALRLLDDLRSRVGEAELASCEAPTEVRGGVEPGDDDVCLEGQERAMRAAFAANINAHERESYRQGWFDSYRLQPDRCFVEKG